MFNFDLFNFDLLDGGDCCNRLNRLANNRPTMLDDVASVFRIYSFHILYSVGRLMLEEREKEASTVHKGPPWQLGKKVTLS